LLLTQGNVHEADHALIHDAAGCGGVGNYKQKGASAY